MRKTVKIFIPLQETVTWTQMNNLRKILFPEMKVILGCSWLQCFYCPGLVQGTMWCRLLTRSSLFMYFNQLQNVRLSKYVVKNDL